LGVVPLLFGEQPVAERFVQRFDPGKGKMNGIKSDNANMSNDNSHVIWEHRKP